MKFTEIFMIFQDNERPESGDLYDSLEKKVLELDFRKYPGANIKAMAIDARKDIKELIKARAWDSKNNSKLCRIFTEAGGKENEEYTSPMYSLLTKVKAKISSINHLNNHEKSVNMSTSQVGWEDILRQAESHYNGMTTPGCICWPPACNPHDSKAPSSSYGANLTQYQNGNGGNQRNGKKNGNGNGNSHNNGSFKGKQNKEKSKYGKPNNGNKKSYPK